MMNYIKVIKVLTVIFLSMGIGFLDKGLAADLETILRRGQLKVAVKDNIRPLAFYNAQGQLQGFEIEIARRLAQEILGDADAIILQPVSNQDRLQVVMDNTVDIAIARVSYTESRSRLVDFSGYYYLDGTGMVTKNPNLQTERDINNQKIAVLRHSSTIAVIRTQFPQVNLVGVNSYQEALQTLESGQADAFAADNTVLSGWVQEYPQYRQLPLRLSGAALCIVMPKGLQYRNLRARIHSAIVQWQESGWLRERALYWGLMVDFD